MDAVIKFSLRIEEEEASPDYEKADGSLDTELNSEIMKRAESDRWAWCYVVVTATIDGCPLSGRAGIGGCSYSGEEEFRQEGGYYSDLCKEAQQDLISKINAVKGIRLPGQREVSETEKIGYSG